MNTDEFIIFITEMDPADAPPEILAKLYDHVSSLTKFAKTVSDCATQAAKAGILPGYELKPGRAKPMRWREATLPDAWYERVALSPAQVIKQNLATEKQLMERGLVERPERDVVPVKIGGRDGEEVF
jgi:hypothetical protein